mmetsp:Transcript_7566/g.19588  ORF Transcript_7566/g.19588 Transcript_7566/m.19588 type:complete len:663 (-) Transcript_7566:132-2120(-)
MPARAAATILVDLLDVGAGAGTRTRRRTSTAHVGHTTRHTTSALVHLGHDRVAQLLELLELGLKLLHLRKLVGIKPLNGSVDRLVDGLLVTRLKLLCQLLVINAVAHVVGVVLKAILGLNLLLVLLILRLVLLCILHHLLDLILGQTALVIGDGNLAGFASGLVLGRHIQDTVGINVECNIDLGHATGRGRDASELELAQQVVVPRARALALVHLDEHAGLVVGVGGEDLLLLGGDGSVAGDKHSHHTTSSLQTQGQRRDVQQQQVLDLLRGLTRQDGSLHSSTVCDGLVGVDALAQLLAVEEVLQKLLHLGDTGGAAHQHHIVNGALVHLGILDHLLDGLNALAEQVGVQLLKAGTGDGGEEVHTLVQGVNLHAGLRAGGQGALRTLACGPQAAHGTGVASDLLLILALELLHKVGHKAVVEILTTKMGVAGGGLDLEDTLLNGQQGHIKRAAAQVEDEHIALASGLVLLVQTIRNGRGSRLVNDTQHIEARNGTSILGGLALTIVEICRHGDHRALDLPVVTKIRLGNLPHLDQHHGADLLCGKSLPLALVVNLNQRLLSGARLDLEGPHLDVVLDGGVAELAANEALGIEDGVGGVHGHLVLGGITNQALAVGEGDIRGRSTVALVVGNDLHAVILPDTHAAVRGAQIDTHCRGLRHDC